MGLRLRGGSSPATVTVSNGPAGSRQLQLRLQRSATAGSCSPTALPTACDQCLKRVPQCAPSPASAGRWNPLPPPTQGETGQGPGNRQRVRYPQTVPGDVWIGRGPGGGKGEGAPAQPALGDEGPKEEGREGLHAAVEWTPQGQAQALVGGGTRARSRPGRALPRPRL